MNAKLHHTDMNRTQWDALTTKRQAASPAPGEWIRGVNERVHHADNRGQRQSPKGSHAAPSEWRRGVNDKLEHEQNPVRDI